MSCRCPNAGRRRRLSPGGGSLSCPGRLELRILVSVSVRLPRALRGPVLRWEDVAPAALKERGRRVKPCDLATAFTSGQFDVQCDTCQWSYRRLMASITKASRRRRAA